MKAVIQGDFHLTSHDGNRLLATIPESTDCVFKEGRSKEIKLENLNRSFSFYVIGIIQLAGIIYGGKKTSPMEEELAELDIEYNDEIDKEFKETFDEFPLWGHLLALSFFPLFLWQYVVRTSNAVLPVGPFSMTKYALAAFILIIFSPMLYFVLVTLVELVFIKGRDRKMARSVLDVSESKEYDEIGLLVGQWHVGRIKRILEGNGWEVEKHNSRVHPERLRQRFF